MTSKTLTSAQVAEIQKALTQARTGRATLSQLAHAHDLAEDACLNGTLGELREHIRAATPRPVFRMEGRDILLGVISGVFTHLLLKEKK
jgi:hypothetical protein